MRCLRRGEGEVVPAHAKEARDDCARRGEAAGLPWCEGVKAKFVCGWIIGKVVD